VTNAIAVAGGQGFIGRAVCESLARGGRVDRVVSLDLTATGAVQGVEERIVDVHQRAALLRELADIDLVVNIVAPYYRHGTDVADAAFESGTHYTDACADLAITDQLLARDEKWRQAGLTLITGLGASPGLVNLAFAAVAPRFDKVLEAHVVWVSGGSEGDEASGETTGTLRDFIHEEFGEVRTFVDGRWVTVTGFKDGAEDVKLGNRIVTVYHAGHTEPITMPRYFPDLRVASCKGNVVPFGMAELIRKGVEIGLNGTDPIPVGGREISPLEFLASYASSPAALRFYDLDSLSYNGGLLLRVVGMRGGKEETDVVPLAEVPEGMAAPSANAGMAAATGVPIAVVSEAIVLREVQQPGAYAPEALSPAVAEKLLVDIGSRLRDVAG